jgi:hypothetical protein
VALACGSSPTWSSLPACISSVCMPPPRSASAPGSHAVFIHRYDAAAPLVAPTRAGLPAVGAKTCIWLTSISAHSIPPRRTGELTDIGLSFAPAGGAEGTSSHHKPPPKPERSCYSTSARRTLAPRKNFHHAAGLVVS